MLWTLWPGRKDAVNREHVRLKNVQILLARALAQPWSRGNSCVQVRSKMRAAPSSTSSSELTRKLVAVHDIVPIARICTCQSPRAHQLVFDTRTRADSGSPSVIEYVASEVSSYSRPF